MCLLEFVKEKNINIWKGNKVIIIRFFVEIEDNYNNSSNFDVYIFFKFLNCLI